MSIQTEITRIAQAKTDIKNVVNSKVANTITNQTIDAFPPLIDSSIAAYKNLIPWIEGSGSSFAIDNAESGKLDKFEMYGNTHQDSHTGKNLLKNTGTSTTKNGLTYTVNSDGTFTINGTATSTTYYEITNSFTFDDGVTYMMSGCPSDGASSSYYIIHNASPWNTDYGRGALVNGTGKTVSIQAVVVSGTTCNNLLFKPQIELGSTKTSFEPYTNGASPNPDYPQDIEVVTGNNTINVHGKNLLNTNLMIEFTPNNTSWWSLDGKRQFYNATNIAISNLYYDLKANTTYTFSVYQHKNISTSVTSPIQLVNLNGNVVSSMKLSDEGLKKTFTTTDAIRIYPRITPNEANVLTQCIVQLEKGSTATTYEPYQSQTYPINLGTMELCKISNYKDKIRKSTGKNLFDKSKATSGYRLDSLGNLYEDATYFASDFIEVNANTFYRTSIEATPYKRICEYDGNKTFITNRDNPNTNSLTTSSTTKYIRVAGLLTELNTTMIYKGSTALPYEPFGKDKWYKHSEIGKIVLDGSETSWVYYSTGQYFYKFWNYPRGSAKVFIQFVSNRYENYQQQISSSDNNKMVLVQQPDRNCEINISNHDYTTVSDFKTWLSTHNTTIYYPLATPTYEIITSETLINQLEAIETHTGTNIFEVFNENNILPDLYVLTEKQNSYKNWKTREGIN